MRTVIEGVHIVPELQGGNEDAAVALLNRYYKPLAQNGKYAGGRWDTFDPSGTRATSQSVFTADDLLACSLLSAPIPPDAVCQLLEGESAARFNALLRAIPTGSDFVDVDPGGPAFVPVYALYWALRELKGVGETRATKLLARKRPFLVPIIDGVVRVTAFPGMDRQWRPLYLALNADNRTLERRLSQLHSAAYLPDAVPTLRVFDVVTWMSDSARAHRDEQESSMNQESGLRMGRRSLRERFGGARHE